MKELRLIMQQLRDPEQGCPWDLQQDFSTIAPYTIEEAYEVADAIQRGDPEDLRDELGDLLFQVVFHAQMADEQGSFDFDDVVTSICDKMKRRHPHVFQDAQIEDASAQSQAWEDAKRQERQQNYSMLFEQEIEPQVLDDLREATNKGWAFGSKGFMDGLRAIANRPPESAGCCIGPD